MPPKIDEIGDRAKDFGKEAIGHVGGFLGEFKAFINRGNVVDLAVGVILGAAFGAVVASLVADIFSPILGLFSTASLQDLFIIMRYRKDSNDSLLEVSYPTVAQAKAAGAITLNYGNFFQSIINFLTVSFCLFLLLRLLYAFKDIASSTKPKPSTDWPCPKCRETVKVGAVRCPHCTAEPIAPAEVVPKTSTEGLEELDEREYLDKA
ncbi:putative Large-conductance mechanosensitive channel [Hypsibius exemplaris]|uniref:Large-conductance mechanosensitive channel n=1 Tax=Hypsibius exemplaris TaxID=2072580 RepID=A0A1W0WXZ3_HYPEX|nr:putative Large-conductance mechanosensitive channel [Hypsibius exemplaris]